MMAMTGGRIMDAAAPASLERSRHLTWTIGGILALLIVISLAIVPLTLTIIHSRESDARIIDLAGRQRMLLERHMKEILLASRGSSVGYQQTRAALQNRVQALLHGGTITVDLEHDKSVSIPSASTEDVRRKLLEQQGLLDALFAKTDGYLANVRAGASNAEAFDALLAGHADLLRGANEVVTLLTRHSEANVRTLIYWELAVVLLVITAASLGTWRFLKTEQALKHSRALTIQALHQRDALKSALLSSVSHELRTPLTAIKTMLFSLRPGGASLAPAVRNEFLLSIDRELEYLNGLVGNLLDMSRLEAGTLTPRREWHVLEELVEGAIRRVEALLAGRRLDVHLAEELPPLSVDGMQIQQVLVNLLDNAIKFSPLGSSIRLTAALVEDSLEVRVSNTGVGVPAEELARIFDRFYRVQSGRPSSMPGTGLGLAICKGIVEAHGGWIVAQSVPGGETTISFCIPVATHVSSADGTTPTSPSMQRTA
jgi:two-component system sensor histidine kinase KdpD